MYPVTAARMLEVSRDDPAVAMAVRDTGVGRVGERS